MFNALLPCRALNDMSIIFEDMRNHFAVLLCTVFFSTIFQIISRKYCLFWYVKRILNLVILASGGRSGFRSFVA